MMRTVFVVDEDIDGRRALGDLLEDQGLQAVLLPGPREAIAALARMRPALVVTDLWTAATPDGASFSALLAEAERSRSPVIVFTAWSPKVFSARPDVMVVAKPNIQTLLPLIEATVCPPSRGPREVTLEAPPGLTAA